MKKEMLEPTLKPKAKKREKKAKPDFMPKSERPKPEFVPSTKPRFKSPKPFIPSFKKSEPEKLPTTKPSFIPVKPIMNNQHPRWTNFLEFVNILFEYNDRRCSGDSKFARFVLSKEGVDIEKSIEYLQDNGGYCDCEILMNVV
jgi:hypothetical protein